MKQLIIKCKNVLLYLILNKYSILLLKNVKKLKRKMKKLIKIKISILIIKIKNLNKIHLIINKWVINNNNIHIILSHHIHHYNKHLFIIICYSLIKILIRMIIKTKKIKNKIIRIKMNSIKTNIWINIWNNLIHIQIHISIITLHLLSINILPK